MHVCISGCRIPPKDFLSLFVDIYMRGGGGGDVWLQGAYVFLDILAGVEVRVVCFWAVHMVSGPSVPVCTPGCVFACLGM